MVFEWNDKKNCVFIIIFNPIFLLFVICATSEFSIDCILNLHKNKIQKWKLLSNSLLYLILLETTKFVKSSSRTLWDLMLMILFPHFFCFLYFGMNGSRFFKNVSNGFSGQRFEYGLCTGFLNFVTRAKFYWVPYV